MYRPLLILLLLPALVTGQMATDTVAIDPTIDGPYLFYEDDQLVAHWTNPEQREAGSAAWDEHSMKELPRFPAFDPSAVQADKKFRRDPQVAFSGVEKIAAMSDIHGQYDVARKLLVEHGITDKAGHWSFGKGHLVIVGDVFDRGDQVNATLWMIHNLQQEAATAGGRVHFLLGNHETMVMEGDIRYINKRYLITSALLKEPYQDLYGPDTYLGRWLRSLPLTIRINDLIFVHGGFSKELVREITSLGKINDLYHRELIDVETSIVTMEDPRLQLLHGQDGPLWYRGYFMESDFEQKDIDRILRKLKAGHMVVGHTSFEAIK
ncbi:MAG: metallophosphoesterase, partial [Bacteroidota bacterium]